MIERVDPDDSSELTCEITGIDPQTDSSKEHLRRNHCWLDVALPNPREANFLLGDFGAGSLCGDASLKGQ
jgi:hypothetical protein